MRKRSLFILICVLALAVALIFSIVGCDNPNGPSGDNEPGGDNDNTQNHIHNWGKWTVVTLPTETQEGSIKRTCDCGVSETFVLPVISENNYTMTRVEPTCEKVGSLTCTLKNSVVNYSFAVELKALGHDYDAVTKKCKRCGKEQIATLDDEKAALNDMFIKYYTSMRYIEESGISDNRELYTKAHSIFLQELNNSIKKPKNIDTIMIERKAFEDNVCPKIFIKKGGAQYNRLVLTVEDSPVCKYNMYIMGEYKYELGSWKCVRDDVPSELDAYEIVMTINYAAIEGDSASNAIYIALTGFASTGVSLSDPNFYVVGTDGKSEYSKKLAKELNAAFPEVRELSEIRVVQKAENIIITAISSCTIHDKVYDADKKYINIDISKFDGNAYPQGMSMNSDKTLNRLGVQKVVTNRMHIMASDVTLKYDDVNGFVDSAKAMPTLAQEKALITRAIDDALQLIVTKQEELKGAGIIEKSSLISALHDYAFTTILSKLNDGSSKPFNINTVEFELSEESAICSIVGRYDDGVDIKLNVNSERLTAISGAGAGIYKYNGSEWICAQNDKAKLLDTIDKISMRTNISEELKNIKNGIRDTYVNYFDNIYNLNGSVALTDGNELANVVINAITNVGKPKYITKIMIGQIDKEMVMTILAPGSAFLTTEDVDTYNVDTEAFYGTRLNAGMPFSSIASHNMRAIQCISNAYDGLTCQYSINITYDANANKFTPHVVSKIHTHSYGDWIVDSEATCSKKGTKHKECACGDVIYEGIPSFGHALTLKRDGKYTWMECVICGEIIDKKLDIYGGRQEAPTSYALGSKVTSLSDTMSGKDMWKYAINNYYKTSYSDLHTISTVSFADEVMMVLPKEKVQNSGNIFTDAAILGGMVYYDKLTGKVELARSNHYGSSLDFNNKISFDGQDSPISRTYIISNDYQLASFNQVSDFYSQCPFINADKISLYDFDNVNVLSTTKPKAYTNANGARYYNLTVTLNGTSGDAVLEFIKMMDIMGTPDKVTNKSIVIDVEVWASGVIKSYNITHIISAHYPATPDGLEPEITREFKATTVGAFSYSVDMMQYRYQNGKFVVGVPNGEWVTITEPECETNGVKARKISNVCIDTEPIPALGHNYENVTLPNGQVVQRCTRCGKQFSDAKVTQDARLYVPMYDKNDATHSKFKYYIGSMNELDLSKVFKGATQFATTAGTIRNNILKATKDGTLSFTDVNGDTVLLNVYVVNAFNLYASQIERDMKDKLGKGVSVVLHDNLVTTGNTTFDITKGAHIYGNGKEIYADSITAPKKDRYKWGSNLFGSSDEFGIHIQDLHIFCNTPKEGDTLDDYAYSGTAIDINTKLLNGVYNKSTISNVIIENGQKLIHIYSGDVLIDGCILRNSADASIVTATNRNKGNHITIRNCTAVNSAIACLLFYGYDDNSANASVTQQTVDIEGFFDMYNWKKKSDCMLVPIAENMDNMTIADSHNSLYVGALRGKAANSITYKVDGEEYVHSGIQIMATGGNVLQKPTINYEGMSACNTFSAKEFINTNSSIQTIMQEHNIISYKGNIDGNTTPPIMPNEAFVPDYTYYLRLVYGE